MLTLVRKGWPLILLLALGAVLAALQNRSYPQGSPSAVQKPAMLALRPFQGSLAVMGGAWNNLSAEVTDKVRLRQDRDRLQQQVGLLSVRNEHLQQVAEENHRLRLLLQMKQHDPGGARWLTADVIERHPSHWFEYFSLDRGSNDGIKKHSVVLTPDGLVGQVVMARPDSCDVLLLTDPSSDAGAIASRTHDVGYIQGTGQSTLEMNFFERDHGVRVGDKVFSSPYSAMYPSGIFIGTVIGVSQQSGTTTRTAQVKPAVQFNNLEEVLVIP